MNSYPDLELAPPRTPARDFLKLTSIYRQHNLTSPPETIFSEPNSPPTPASSLSTPLHNRQQTSPTCPPSNLLLRRKFLPALQPLVIPEFVAFPSSARCLQCRVSGLQCSLEKGKYQERFAYPPSPPTDLTNEISKKGLDFSLDPKDLEPVPLPQHLRSRRTCFRCARNGERHCILENQDGIQIASGQGIQKREFRVSGYEELITGKGLGDKGGSIGMGVGMGREPEMRIMMVKRQEDKKKKLRKERSDRKIKEVLGKKNPSLEEDVLERAEELLDAEEKKRMQNNWVLPKIDGKLHGQLVGKNWVVKRNRCSEEGKDSFENQNVSEDKSSIFRT